MSPSAHSPVTLRVEAAQAADVDADDLGDAITAALLAEGYAGCEVTLVIVEDKAIADLNRAYLGIEEPTDVLSFPARETNQASPKFVSAPEMFDYLGDIVIALPFTRRQAAALGHPLRDELRLLAVHGTLHLLGYDHAEPGDEALMWARQDAILQQLRP